MNQKKFCDVNSKWLKFIEVKFTGKTYIYDVISKDTNIKLGEIKWYSSWRKYSFYPLANTIFEKTCLNDIISFIDTLMNERK